AIENLQDHLSNRQMPILADMYRRKALIYEAQDSMSQALTFYNRSMSVYGGGNGNKRDRSRNFQGMARAFLAKGKLDSAMIWNQKDFDNLVPTYGPDFVQLAESYRMAGLIFAAQNDYENAIAQFQLGLEKAAPSFKALTWKDLPKVQQFEFVPPVLSILNHKAKALTSLYERNRDRLYLEAAYETYQLGITFITNLRSSYQEDETKEIIQKDGAAIYEGAIECLRTIGRAQNSALPMDSLFQLINDSKSILLKEAAYDRAARALAQIPDSLMEYEQELRRKISNLKYNQRANENPRIVRERRYELAQLSQYLDEIRLEIKNQYPKYYDFKFRQTHIKIKDIQAELGTKQAYLQYYLAGNQPFAFLIQKDTSSLIQLEISKGLEQKIIHFRGLIINPKSDLEPLALASQELYQQLFSPIAANLKDHVNQILIIPDGALSYLPFDVLIDQIPEQAKFSGLPYLMKRYTISYSFTPSFWIDQHLNVSQPGQANRLLAIAPSYQVSDTPKEDILSLLRNEALGNLPGAQEEALGVVQLLGGNTLLGLAATEATFKSIVDDYNIFHLSMHGVLDDEHPENAYLAFQQEDPSLVDEWNDNYLRVAELYGMQLDAKLVVLSACNTGIGQIHNGEGMLSLARAFKYSGAKSLVTSLWSVSDFSTKELMLMFYQYLKKGDPKHIAMQKAKQAYLEKYNDPLFSHPFYWSGFNVVGDTTAIYQRQNTHWIWYAGGFLLFVLALFQVRKYLSLS
ncbi:MAG: CHAT domain-containing protein, partial [Bacteroidota bacterium]